MSKFLVLLLLLSSEFQFGEFQESSELKTNDRFSSVQEEIQQLKLELSNHPKMINSTAMKMINYLHKFYGQYLEAMENEGDATDEQQEEEGLAEVYEPSSLKNILHECGEGRSPQQILLNTYTEVRQDETATMEEAIFSTLMESPEDSDILVGLTMIFVSRYNAYVNKFSRDLDKAARDHRSCDPHKEVGWKRGTSFFELEKYIQATTFHLSGSTPFMVKECNEWIDKISAKKDDPNSLCQGPRSSVCWMDPVEKCHGTLYGCYYSISARCINEPGNPRRYSWLSPKWSPEYPIMRDTMCKGNGRYLHEGFDDSCVCHCVEGHNKISLDLSLSDIGKNRVVTAMRLAQKDGIVFIQIKQGTLQPNGSIVDESSSWEPSSPPRASDKLFELNVRDQGINLDDLQGADNEVLTGMGFARVDEAPNTRVKLQIRVTQFSYIEGQLGGQSRIISASDQNRTMEMLDNKNPLDSGLTNGPTTLTRDSSKKFINFIGSDTVTDAGQTTLPLFDAVPVYGRPASPLGGVGLFYKKAPNYAGFLSLRAIGINAAKYFKDSVKPITAKQFAFEYFLPMALRTIRQTEGFEEKSAVENDH